MKRAVFNFVCPAFLFVVLLGAPLTHADRDHDLALFEATTHSVPDPVAELLMKGANPNFEDENGVTPLINAALRGNVKIAILLLNAGAEVDKEGRNGCTPLTWAARNGRVRMISLLLDRDADIDHRNHMGLTPLMRGAWNGQLEAIALLIRRGADLAIEDSAGNTALTYALAGNNLAIVKLIRDAGVVPKAQSVEAAKERIAKQAFIPCTKSALTG